MSNRLKAVTKSWKWRWKRPLPFLINIFEAGDYFFESPILSVFDPVINFSGKNNKPACSPVRCGKRATGWAPVESHV
jgi:hypothetical protein